MGSRKNNKKYKQSQSRKLAQKKMQNYPHYHRPGHQTLPPLPMDHTFSIDPHHRTHGRALGQRSSNTPTSIQVPQDLKDSPSYIQSERAKRRRDSVKHQPSFSSADGLVSDHENMINKDEAQQNEQIDRNSAVPEATDSDKRKLKRERKREKSRSKKSSEKVDKHQDYSSDPATSDSSSSPSSGGSASPHRTAPDSNHHSHSASNPLKRKLFDPLPGANGPAKSKLKNNSWNDLHPIPSSPKNDHRPNPTSTSTWSFPFQQVTFQTAMKDLASMIPAEYLSQTHNYILTTSKLNSNHAPHDLLPDFNRIFKPTPNFNVEQHEQQYTRAATSTIQAARLLLRDISLKHSLSGNREVIEELMRIVREKEMRVRELEGEVSGLKWVKGNGNGKGNSKA